MAKKRNAPHSHRREPVMPVRAERPLSGESLAELTNFMVAAFGRVAVNADPAVTLLSRRIASSYANRPGSQLPQSPDRFAQVLDEALPPSAHTVVALGVTGLRVIDQGYMSRAVIDVEGDTVAKEALALHEALWRGVGTGARGKRPELQSPHIRLGDVERPLSANDIEELTMYIPPVVILDPVKIHTDLEFGGSVPCRQR